MTEVASAMRFYYVYILASGSRVEKQLKGWRRAKKVRLIEEMNPNWVDLPPPDRPGPSLRSR
jgi:hypothetical protein